MNLEAIERLGSHQSTIQQNHKIPNSKLNIICLLMRDKGFKNFPKRACRLGCPSFELTCLAISIWGTREEIKCFGHGKAMPKLFQKFSMEETT